MLVQLVVFFTIFWLLIREWKRRHIEKLYRQLKISAPRLPFIGHLYLFLCNKIELMKNIQQLGREAIGAGRITGFWFTQNLYIHIADPNVADIVLKKCLEKDDLMKCFHIFTGYGSIFSAVKFWRPRRRFLKPTFSMTNLNKFTRVFSNQSQLLIEKLQNNPRAEPISMRKIYSSYSMESILESLGIPKKKNKQFLVAIEEAFKIVTKRIFKPWLHSDFVFRLLPQYQRLMRQIPFVYLDKIIQEKQEQRKKIHVELKNDNRPTTFIDLMSESDNMGNLAIREESIVIVTAASDTTAISLEFISLMLAKYPEMQQNVYNEVKKVIGDVYRPILKEDLPHLKYLEAFIQETLRLYPAVPLIVRKIDKIVEISKASGITLLPGCGAVINIWAINRNPTYWGKDADEFRPERFLADSASRPKSAFATFSLGPRNCIGFQYAMMSMKTVISTVLQQYRLVPASDSIKNEPLVEFDIMMRHLDHCCVGFEARK